MDLSIFNNYNVNVSKLNDFLNDCCEDYSYYYKYLIEDDLNANDIYPDYIETEIFVDSRDEITDFNSKVNIYGFYKYYLDDALEANTDMIMQNMPLWKATFLMNLSVLTTEYPNSYYEISNSELVDFLNTYFGKK